MTERNVPHCTGASPAPKPVPNSLVTVASTPVLASRPVTVALDREVRGLTILLYQVGLKVPCAPKWFDVEFPLIKTTKLLVKTRSCTWAKRIYPSRLVSSSRAPLTILLYYVGASPAPKPVPNPLVTVASTPVFAARPVTAALDREVRGLTIVLPSGSTRGLLQPLTQAPLFLQRNLEG